MIKIILHGSLKGRYPEFSVEAGTVAEAVEAWSRQTDMAQMPIDERPVIEVVGYGTVESMVAPLDRDVSELHLIPSMFGGGGAVRVVIGAALVAAAFLPFIPVWLKPVMISMGISLIAGGIFSSVNNAPKEVEASKYLSSGKNTTAIGTTIAMGGGRMKVAGQYLSLQVNSNDMVTGQFPATVPA